jgi:spermidine synthase
MRSRSLRSVPASPAADLRPPAWLTGLVLLCFLTSGATSLILEGTLVRLLRFVLGNTTLAVTTVLCAFMAGLALGSYVGGRLCDRSTRLLRMYGVLEGAVGVSCLVLPWCIVALEPAYRWMYVHLADTPLWLSLARFVLCGWLLLIPSTFMGATLPVLSRWYALRFGRIGQSVAGLYAINSLGAGAGALLCGFALLPALGLTWTLRLACLVDIGICLLMLLLDRVPEAGPAGVVEPAVRVESREEGVPEVSSAWRTGLIVAYGVSGAAALVYEVAWTRALALVIGSTTYAFSLMLAAFIVGLAVGSGLMVRWVDRVANRVYWFAVVELGIGVAALATVPVFGEMPIWVVGIVRQFRRSFATLQAAQFALSLLVMVVPTTLMGVAFPLVSRACITGSSRLGRSIGSVYASNTVGGIVGAFLASFLLIPGLGTQNTILIAAAANVLIGLAVLLPLFSVKAVRRAVPGAAAVVFFAAAWFGFPQWDPYVMSSGAYLYADDLAGQTGDAATIKQRMRQDRIVFNKEDMCTMVTVRDTPRGVRMLAIGGKTDASTGDDAPTQLLLAHAPLLLHPNPRNVLVVGLASGMTLGSAACYDLERIECVEISPAVVEASRFFDDYNGHVLSDPRVQLIVADGRNHLALTARQYDVIISEPSNPWIAGVSDLFTREYFEVCRRRLAPGGLIGVWLQAYRFEEALFRSVAGTFADVFPCVIVFETVPWADYLLVGSVEPIRVPYDVLVGRLRSPKIAADLNRIGISGPVDFLRTIIVSQGVREYAAGATLHTDDNALLEFASPRALYRADAGVRIAESLNRYRKVDVSALLRDPADSPAIQELHRTLAPLVEAQRFAMDAIARHYQGELPEAHQLARRASQLDPAGPELLINVVHSILGDADARLQQGDLGRALKYCFQAANLAPDLYVVQEKLGEMLVLARQWQDAADVFRRAATLHPQEATPANNLAWLRATCPDDAIRNGREAVEWGERACRITEYKNTFCLRSLAAAYAEAGRFDEAIRTAEGALEMARQNGPPALAATLERDLSLYRQGQPVRLPVAE